MQLMFPKYQTEQIARNWGCFHCHNKLSVESKIQKTEYPMGKYTIKCILCNMNTWFDLESK